MQTKLADETTGQQMDDAHQARVQAALGITLHALQAVLADIDRLNRPRADTSQPSPMAALDQAGLQPQWRRLSMLIADNDAQARELLHEVLQAQPGLHQHPRIVELQRMLDRYDFDAAARTLEDIRS